MAISTCDHVNPNTTIFIEKLKKKNDENQIN